jgi:cysteine-rich repeat protein
MKNKMKKHFKVLLTLVIVCAFSATGYYFSNALINVENDDLKAALMKICGDAFKVELEQCDDGNTTNGDGCSSICTIEPGYECIVVRGRSVCSLRCGNGLIDRGEECDDGNTTNGDGCSSTCIVEYVAQGPCGSPSECNAIEATFSQIGITDDLVVGANATVGGTLDVTGTSTFANTAVTGILTLANLTLDNLTVNTLGTIASLTVTGDSTLDGLTAGASTLSSLTVTGASTLAGLTAGASSLSSLTVNSTLTANGNVTLGNAATDIVTVNGALTTNSTLTANGDVNLGDADTDTVTANSIVDIKNVLKNTATIMGVIGKPLKIDDSLLTTGFLSTFGDVYLGNTTDFTSVPPINSPVGIDKTFVRSDLYAKNDIITDRFIRSQYGIGRIYNKSLNYSIPAGSTFGYTQSCNTGDWALSCNGGFINNVGSNYIINAMWMPAGVGNCKVSGQNASGAAADLMVQARCYAPDENLYEHTDGTMWIINYDGSMTGPLGL